MLGSWEVREAWLKAYCGVYGFGHQWADCRGVESAPEPTHILSTGLPLPDYFSLTTDGFQGIRDSCYTVWSDCLYIDETHRTSCKTGTTGGLHC